MPHVRLNHGTASFQHGKLVEGQVVSVDKETADRWHELNIATPTRAEITRKEDITATGVRGHVTEVDRLRGTVDRAREAEIRARIEVAMAAEEAERARQGIIAQQEEDAKHTVSADRFRADVEAEDHGHHEEPEEADETGGLSKGTGVADKAQTRVITPSAINAGPTKPKLQTSAAITREDLNHTP